jgi:intermediate cleaving peptidase 55
VERGPNADMRNADRTWAFRYFEALPCAAPFFVTTTMRRSLLRPLQANIHACRPRPLASFRSRQTLPAVRTLVSAAECQFGQPLHETHPHLIAPGDLTPGISALEYHHRRAALASKLPKNGIAILASNEVKYRSGAVFYEFHQEPNFYYLTGKEQLQL